MVLMNIEIDLNSWREQMEALLHVQFYALSQPAQFAEPVHTFWHEENRELNITLDP